MSRRTVLALAGWLALGGRAFAALQETPMLAAAVAGSRLPKIGDRIPAEPAIAEPTTLGIPGGDLRMLMAGPKDTRMMVVYGYARLVAYTPELDLVPDILKALEVAEGRIFTLHLRRGHKWSDGKPFTAEDFRYWFEDVAQNRKLSPAGLPVQLMPQGEKPRFTLIDEVTVRYEWARPNPLFLPLLAGADPLFIYCPSHYLKQFHIKFADKAALEALVTSKGQRNWAALHNKMDRMYHNDNPDLPSLEPWVLRTRPPAQRLIFTRNPYYYRVDKAGRQLPYIDRVIMTIADARIIPAKTGAGESDLQARYLRFDNYTFLKAGEHDGDYQVRLWSTGPGSQLALYPNLNVNDPVWRKVWRDVRVRRALSLGVNRHEINEVIYFGLALEGQNTLLPRSPLYKPEYRKAWAQFDLAGANRLLDEVGLTQRDGNGTRLLPDGRPMEVIIEDSGESTEQSDALELVRDSWRHLGIRVFAKPSQLSLFRSRVFAGKTVMSIAKGIDNGLATAEMSPWEFAPTSQQELEWPKWGQYMETKGAAGEAPDLPAAVRLKQLYEAWLAAATKEEHAAVWEEMLKIWADEVYTIGTVAGVLQPVVVNDRLRNVPQKGVWNWDPGAFFGMYKPDGFWFAPAGEKSAAADPAPRSRPRRQQ